MLTIKNKIANNLSSQVNKRYNINDTIFFDIETTGLSAKTSYVYLIGCMYYEKKSWYIIQWLLDDPSKEAQLLELLSNKLKTYKRIIHYNGDSFDIPFLREKYRRYNLRQPFSDLDSYDLYKEVLPYKKLFPFPNLKLKTLEKYLGVNRQDKYSGGQLINIYSQFIGRAQYEKLIDESNKVTKKAKEASSKDLGDILLLHNFEDLAGLLDITSIVSYVDFLNKGIREKDLVAFDYKISNNELFINLELTDHFPYEIGWSLANNLSDLDPAKDMKGSANDFNDKNICKTNKYSTMELKGESIHINFPLNKNKLKYFYENYKDYYYLPQEDMAIHKSVAKYVDRDFRIRANSTNSYSYVEIDNILDSKDNLVAWCNSFLAYIISNKNFVSVRTSLSEVR